MVYNILIKFILEYLYGAELPVIEVSYQYLNLANTRYTNKSATYFLCFSNAYYSSSCYYILL